MSSSSELVAVDLSKTERDLITQVLQQWGWSASGKRFPFQVLGLLTWKEFGALVVRLIDAVSSQESLTDLDWARVMFLTEITWASSLFGSGLDFAIVSRFSDAEALVLLRGLQRKLSGYNRAKLLFPDGGRIHTAEENEEQNRWAGKVRHEQQGRQYPPGL
jgi:hypothetical protein